MYSPTPSTVADSYVANGYLERPSLYLSLTATPPHSLSPQVLSPARPSRSSIRSLPTVGEDTSTAAVERQEFQVDDEFSFEDPVAPELQQDIVYVLYGSQDHNAEASTALDTVVAPTQTLATRTIKLHRRAQRVESALVAKVALHRAGKRTKLQIAAAVHASASPRHVIMMTSRQSLPRNK